MRWIARAAKGFFSLFSGESSEYSAAVYVAVIAQIQTYRGAAERRDAASVVGMSLVRDESVGWFCLDSCVSWHVEKRANS